MVYQKRKTSRILEEIEVRATGLAAIDPNMDFGDERSLKNIGKKTALLREKLNAYNTALTDADTLRSEIKELEKEMAVLSSEMLLAVAFRYGKDSLEYQKAGGVRRSERIRRSSHARIEVENPLVEV